MTFNEFMTRTREQFSTEIPAFCEERGLEPLRVVFSAFRLDEQPLTVAVFPTASQGSTCSEEGNACLAWLTVMLYCNESATEEGTLQAEKYFSVMIQYLQKTCFGEASAVRESVLCRMDEDEPVNGGVFKLEARISTHTDYGWG